jgi:RHS repeat-associated protein
MPAEGLAGVQVNMRFPGQYYDQETNLHYNWNRYYDLSLGRYITSDPIGLQGGMNTYGYVMQNPIMLYDLLGLAWDCTFIQSTGQLSCTDDQTGDSVYEKCYSGSESKGGKNNPDKQDDEYDGPIPRGDWGIGSHDESKGPVTIDLIPKAGNDVYSNGRGPWTFRMHGDSQESPGDASEGCIICSRKTRDTLTNGAGGNINVKAYPWD